MSEQPELPQTPAIKHKQDLYGEWQKGEEATRRRWKWQDALQQRATYKALDIAQNPNDEMGGIQANKEMVVNNSGLSPVWLLAALALGGAGLYFYSQNQQPAAQSTQPPAQVGDPLDDRDYVVRFYDKDGKEIIVDRKPQ